MDKEFTNKLQTWLSLPREDRDWDEGMILFPVSCRKQNHVSQPQCEP